MVLTKAEDETWSVSGLDLSPSFFSSFSQTLFFPPSRTHSPLLPVELDSTPFVFFRCENGASTQWTNYMTLDDRRYRSLIVYCHFSYHPHLASLM